MRCTNRPTRSSSRRRRGACRSASTSRPAPRRGTPAPRPGTTRNACNIFVRNAKPMTQPANAIQRVLAVSVARTMQYAAATSSRTSSASGLLNRNISAATGVSASAAPAIRPAAGPLVRRTVAYSSATARDAHQRLRQQHRERAEPEQPAGQAHHPHRCGRLVDRDRVARVQRAEQPRLPVLRACLRRGRVVVVGPAGRAEPPQVQHGGRGQQRQHARGAPSAASRRGGPCGGRRLSAARTFGGDRHQSIPFVVGGSQRVRRG